MQISICAVLCIQLVLVLVFSTGVFLYTIVMEEEAIAESVEHGEVVVSTCFDQYLGSIETIGKSFITDISLSLKRHVNSVVDSAEAKTRAAATTVERMNFMETLATNSWHGSQLLPTFGWTILSPLEEGGDGEDAVVSDIVIASMNATEDTNTWVWLGLPERSPNPTLHCDFYYYRNATDKMSSLWCLDDLYKQPNQPSPSMYPHPYSPAIYKLQNATPRVPPTNETRRPVVWMPMNFYVWTSNVVALTSVVGGVFGPDGSLQGLAAANVRFASVAKYLASLVDSSRYANLSIALIETDSGKILGTSLGSAIYKENQTRPDGTTKEVEQAASLGTMEDPLARELNRYVEERYGSINLIPTPLIASVMLQNHEYFVSFDTFSRPLLNLTICAFVPQDSITGPIEEQRRNALFLMESDTKNMADERQDNLIIVIIMGVCGVLACGLVAALTALFLSSRINQLVNYMEKVRTKLSNIDNVARVATTNTNSLVEPLPADFVPHFGTTLLKDINSILDSTNDLCSQLLKTWNTKQEAFKQALEQRQFTASIAHDIRNPLHGVLGIVSMMQSNIDDHKDKLPLLADTLKHMSVLLNDMVDLSKIQGGKVTHASTKFDAWNTLEEVVTLYRNSAEASGGTLSCMERTSLPLIYSDPIHVLRIMTNFVSNATKYAPGNDIRLNAILANRQELQSLSFLQKIGCPFSDGAPHWSENARLVDDCYIVLACLDNGPGIAESKLDKVFEAYQQTLDSDRYRGAGLGLAIVKGLATELGGGVGVQSRLGSGSLFWLVVTCASVDLVTEKAPPHSTRKRMDPTKFQEQSCPLTSREPGINLTRPTHVLVVDDTNLNLMLVTHFLTKLGIKSDKAASASEALTKLREDPTKFSLVLSDFHMPDMSGGELCLEVRKDFHLCHLPFICTSGSYLTEDEKEKYKIDDTMVKPFTMEQLRKTITPYLEPTEASDEENSS